MRVTGANSVTKIRQRNRADRSEATLWVDRRMVRRRITNC
jgi:hypothetical protein